MRRRLTVPLLLALAALAALALAACTSDDDGQAAAIDTSAPSTLAVAHPDFNYGAAVWQGYWLSRDHFGPFVMASGMGIPFQPPMDVLMAAMQMVAQNPDDAVMVPQNLMPLQAIFRSGSPQLVNDPRDFGPMDFEAFRLDPASFDTTVGVRGQAETMLKESQWARNFASAHFGTPAGEFGAQQRFIGLMVNMLARMQGQYAMQQLMGDGGLYLDSDGALDYAANWVMLQALSDISGIAAEQGSRYANPDAAGMFDDAATALYRALSSREPDSPAEAALAIRALTFRAWTAADGELRADVLDRAREIADSQLMDVSTDDVVSAFAAVAGLVSVDAVQDDGDYRKEASKLFDRLADDFEGEHGVFKSRSTYSVDDVAWIIGGLNSLILEGRPADRAEAARMLVAFFESTLDNSGMQLSAPPGKNGAMAGEWEKTLPSLVYYHGEQTAPPPVSGMLTVPAREIRWDGSAWSVTDTTFVPAEAMHLANELNWLGPHLGALLFPPVSAQ